jgi:drug/metabolite transporter (DMT)-like permease
LTSTTTAAAPAQAHVLKGIVLVVLATLAFALSDVVTKQQAMRHPIAIVVAVRYIVNLLVVTALLYPRMGAELWRMNRGGLVFLRGLCLAFASLTMGIALRLMPVGETVAIIYLAPFVVMLLAVPILGEKVRLSGWFGAIAGFTGVLLIMRPGSGLDPWGVTLALINVGFATAYHLLTRLLAKTEGTVPLLWHTALVGSVFFGIGALGSASQIAAIGAVDLGMMVLLGALATIGHFLFTAAYREAPASLLAPVNYLHLFWAGGLGWLAFGHVPDRLAAIGMFLVFLSGVWVALTARRT